MTEEFDEELSYESGSYCQHWMLDCEEICICTHRCARHPSDEECIADGCSCVKFTSVEQK